MTNHSHCLLFALGFALSFLLSEAQSVYAETVTGTGFAITHDGVMITNHHVVGECSLPIKVRAEGIPDYYYEATVLADDPNRDLAALKIERRVGQGNQSPIREIPKAIFRRGPPLQQGETAITYGFPLSGLLTPNGNLTSGIVSALSGPRDDHKYVQVTTPVQQGNSGGPLYDSSGHIIGVVVAKLDALKVMLATGDVPQNVNFAISLDVVWQFIREHSLNVAEEDSSAEPPPTEIAKRAKLSTYSIECTPHPRSQTKVRPPESTTTTSSSTELACIGQNGFTVNIAFDERARTVLFHGLRRALIDRNLISFKWVTDDGDTYYHHINRSTGVMIVQYGNTSRIDTYACSRAQKRF